MIQIQLRRGIEYRMENIRAQRNDELDFVLAPKYIGIQAGRTSSRMTGIEDQNRKKKNKKNDFFR